MESGVGCDGLASWQKRVERYMKDNLGTKHWPEEAGERSQAQTMVKARAVDSI
jgi:hypothetical protein